MRTAEKIVSQMILSLNIDREMFKKFIGEIQDEAVAHGMTISAEIGERDWLSAGSRIKQAILTARDNKVWRKEPTYDECERFDHHDDDRSSI